MRYHYDTKREPELMCEVEMDLVSVLESTSAGEI